MGTVHKASFGQSEKYLAACRRAASKPATRYLDVMAQIEAETNGALDNDELSRRVEDRGKALGLWP